MGYARAFTPAGSERSARGNRPGARRLGGLGRGGGDHGHGLVIRILGDQLAAEGFGEDRAVEVRPMVTRRTNSLTHTTLKAFETKPELPRDFRLLCHGWNRDRDLACVLDVDPGHSVSEVAGLHPSLRARACEVPRKELSVDDPRGTHADGALSQVCAIETGRHDSDFQVSNNAE
jgi:hypothetical protein